MSRKWRLFDLRFCCGVLAALWSIALGVLASPAIAAPPLILAADGYRYRYDVMRTADGLEGRLTATVMATGIRVTLATGLPPPGCERAGGSGLTPNRRVALGGRSFVLICGSDGGRSNVLLVLGRGKLVGRLDFGEQPPQLAAEPASSRFVGRVYRRVLQPQGNLFAMLMIYELNVRTSHGFGLSFAPERSREYLQYYRELASSGSDAELIAQSLLGALVGSGDRALVCAQLRTGPLAKVSPELIAAAAANLGSLGFPSFTPAECR